MGHPREEEDVTARKKAAAKDKDKDNNNNGDDSDSDSIGKPDQMNSPRFDVVLFLFVRVGDIWMNPPRYYVVVVADSGSNFLKMFLQDVIHISGGSIMRTLEQKRIGKLMKKRKSDRTCILRIYSHGLVQSTSLN